MARLDALSIELVEGSGKAKLAEEYGKVVENIQAITLSTKLKNQDLSGNPTAGTLEVKRFANVEGKAYGTARTAGKGNTIKEQTVVVSIDDDIEYIEEVEEKDLMTYGVDGLIERRTKNHQDVFAVDLDKKFFAAAVTGATDLTLTATDVEDQVEEAIQQLESLQNKFVQGVPRNVINVIAKPKVYGALRTKINAIPNSQGLVSMANYEEGIFNNTRIYSSTFLPADVDFIVMVDGSVAQPVSTSILNPAKLELSDKIGFGLFTYKGTKNVSPDLVLVKKNAEDGDDEGEAGTGDEGEAGTGDEGGAGTGDEGGEE